MHSHRNSLKVSCIRRELIWPIRFLPKKRAFKSIENLFDLSKAIGQLLKQWKSYRAPIDSFNQLFARNFIVWRIFSAQSKQFPKHFDAIIALQTHEFENYNNDGHRIGLCLLDYSLIRFFLFRCKRPAANTVCFTRTIDWFFDKIDFNQYLQWRFMGFCRPIRGFKRRFKDRIKARLSCHIRNDFRAGIIKEIA